MKHFEEVWLEAEVVAKEYFISGKNSGNIRELVKILVSEKDKKKISMAVGDMLFYLSFICQDLDINSWEEMRAATNRAKVENYEGEENT